MEIIRRPLVTNSQLTCFDEVVKIAKSYSPSLELNQIHAIIQKREELGDTYIGNKTILLHLETKAVVQQFILVLQAKQEFIWNSSAKESQHVVNRLILLGINPNKSADEFNSFLKTLSEEL